MKGKQVKPKVVSKKLGPLMELLAVLCGDKTWSKLWRLCRLKRLGSWREGKNVKTSPVICTAVLFKAFADVSTAQTLRSEEKAVLFSLRGREKGGN